VVKKAVENERAVTPFEAERVKEREGRKTLTVLRVRGGREREGGVG
jgi:hypothetical protein